MKRSENRKNSLKAAALGTVELRAATLIKEKLQNIKAAALKPTGMKAAALAAYKENLWKLRPRRSCV